MQFVYNDIVNIDAGDAGLEGQLTIPENARGLVIFSHGSGSSRHSPRNLMVAKFLQENNFATLLFDLLTAEEDQDYQSRFNIELLSVRLMEATLWLEKLPQTRELNFGYFGASTGAASALNAAARLPDLIKAVVSRGGRPDMSMENLPKVKTPTLLIVGGLDAEVIRLNEEAYAQLNCIKELEIVEGATHLFEEPGKMQEVCEWANGWFEKYL